MAFLSGRQSFGLHEAMGVLFEVTAAYSCSNMSIQAARRRLLFAAGQREGCLRPEQLHDP